MRIKFNLEISSFPCLNNQQHIGLNWTKDEREISSSEMYRQRQINYLANKDYVRGLVHKLQGLQTKLEKGDK